MIAAISSAVSASLSSSSRAAASTTTGWYYVQVPDLNTATHRLIGTSKAGWTFETICRLLHHVGRVGTAKAKRAAKADQALGVGLTAIADESGQSLGKVRRDCAALAKIGVIVVTHPNVLMIRGADGRLTENRTGRSKATVIHLTITQEHVRQKAANPARTEGLPAANSVHPGRAIQKELNTERTPDGGAVGIGTPPAVAEAPATTPILPVDAGRDEPPMPAGRILPTPGITKARTPSEAKRVRRDLDAPRPWTQDELDALARTRARLEAQEQARRTGEAAEPRRPAEAPSAPPPPDRPARANREASVDQNLQAWRKALAAMAGKAVA